MRTFTCGIFALAIATGCTTLGDSSSNVEGGDGDTNGGGDIDRDDCKIEGDTIGQDGAILRLGTRTVTFHDWVRKTGENELVGFSISLSGASSVGYVVKSGGDLSHSTASTWLNAAGPDGGDKAPGISNVDFCENCEDGSCGGGDGGGDGSGSDGGGGDCTEPGGCDGSGGDGPVL